MAPTPVAVQTHDQIASQIKQGAAAPLKKTEVAHDASAPKVEPTVHIKANPHPAVMADVQKVRARAFVVFAPIGARRTCGLCPFLDTDGRLI